MLPRDLPDVDVVAWDVEASGLFPDSGATVACVAVAWYEGDDLRSAAWPWDQGERDKFAVTQLDLFESGRADPNLGQAEWDELMGWLATRKLLVAHNALYDTIMTAAGTRHFAGRNLVRVPCYCTMLAARELDPTFSAGLDASSRRAGLPGKKGLDAILDWNRANARRLRPSYPKNAVTPLLKRYDLAPWSVAEPYVTVDAELTIQLFRHQVHRLAADPATSARAKREFKLMKVLTLLEQRGIGYDGRSSSDAATLLDGRADALAAKLPFVCTGNGMKAYFCGTLGLQTDRLTEKGAPSLDAEQMLKWATEGVEYAREAAMVSKIRRTVSMHYRGYPDKLGADGRLRTRFKQATVKSGRLACERVQLQALPKEDKTVDGVPHIKKLILPKAGYGLYNLDLAQAELRVAAHLAGCHTMLEAVARGDDLHGQVCHDVMRIPYDAPDWKFKRDIAKRANFGGIVGVGPPTFQATLSKLAGIHLPMSECARIVYGWRKKYPEFMTLKEKLGELVEKREREEGVGYIVILKGTELERRSYFGARDQPHTAWSRAMQCSTATAFMQMMVEIEDRWPGYLILTVHDSLLLEIPLDVAGGAVGDEYDEGSSGIIGDICAYAGVRMTELLGTPMEMEGERTK